MSSLSYLLRLAWAVPMSVPLGPRRSTIILYHGVPASDRAPLSQAAFEEHILFLKKHFVIINERDADRPPSEGDKPKVLLTFDDGYRNNAEVVAPILRRHGVPAIFFISSRHSVPNQYLWFSYLSALEGYFPDNELTFRGERFDMSPGKRPDSVARLRQTLLALTPHPAAMYEAIAAELPPVEEFVRPEVLADRYAGMSAEQAGELAADPLFSIGAHTVDHPFLTRCETAEAERQIRDNRAWLQAACGRTCDTIAYPSGDYDSAIVNECRSIGFKRGYAVAARPGEQSDLALSRIGIYSESTDVLGFKVMWGALVRRVGLPIG